MADRLLALQTRLKKAVRRHWTYRLAGRDLPDGGTLWRASIPARGRQVARVCVVAGMRGDEPATIEALVRVLETGGAPAGVAAEVFPCMHPMGFAAGCREDAQGRDLVAAFGATPRPAVVAAFAAEVAGSRFDVFVHLLETDLDGFYALELEGERMGLGAGLVTDLVRQGYRAASTEMLEAHGGGASTTRARIRDGLVMVRSGDGAWPEVAPVAFMRAGHARHALAIASPRRMPLERRVQFHASALAALWRELARDARFAALAAQGRIVPFTSGPQRR